MMSAAAHKYAIGDDSMVGKGHTQPFAVHRLDSTVVNNEASASYQDDDETVKNLQGDQLHREKTGQTP